MPPAPSTRASDNLPPGPWLSKLVGQDTARTTLSRALASGRVHHVLLFDGPKGVGKELAAFGLAQALVCTSPTAGNQACGQCSACARAVPRGDERRPRHPDVVVLERGLYEPGQIGRRTPETQDISIDQVRTLVLARAAFSPHEGRAKVFIVRHAEELSTSAANALLKTLEEPLANTHFVLLTAHIESLLPTIRSRALRVRFGALDNSVVLELLVAQGVDPKRAEEASKLSAGSVEHALLHADPDRASGRESFLSRAVAALEAPDLLSAMDLAELAKKEKSELSERLEAFAEALADSARKHAAAADRRAERDALRHRLAVLALEELGGNASPQLVVEAMFVRMRAVP